MFPFFYSSRFVLANHISPTQSCYHAASVRSLFIYFYIIGNPEVATTVQNIDLAHMYCIYGTALPLVEEGILFNREAYSLTLSH
jgi:hypothetical protein